MASSTSPPARLRPPRGALGVGGGGQPGRRDDGGPSGGGARRHRRHARGSPRGGSRALLRRWMATGLVTRPAAGSPASASTARGAGWCRATVTATPAAAASADLRLPRPQPGLSRLLRVEGSNLLARRNWGMAGGDATLQAYGWTIPMPNSMPRAPGTTDIVDAGLPARPADSGATI